MCSFAVRWRLSLWLDLCRLRLRLLPLCDSRIAYAPACLLFRVLFWFAVRRQWAHRIDRPVIHSANFKVRLVVTKELFPVFYALEKENQDQNRSISDRHQTRRDGVNKRFSPLEKGSLWGRGRQWWTLTRISLSESPRRSCVRCSLKQPVPNERAASTPALIIIVNTKKVHTTPIQRRRTWTHRILPDHRRDDCSKHQRLLHQSTKIKKDLISQL